MKLTSINTLEDVKQFVHILMKEEKLAFHPDTPFEGYINLNTNEPTYSIQDVVLRDRLLNQAFELGEQLDVDTHELMCTEGANLFHASLESLENSL